MQEEYESLDEVPEEHRDNVEILQNVCEMFDADRVEFLDEDGQRSIKIIFEK